jgi:hypothetical protein
VLAAAAVLLISQLLAPPHFVSHVTVDNPTPYQFTVEVSKSTTDGWLPLGTVDRSGATQFGEVYDIGDAWTVRVSTQGEIVGEFRVTRARLEQSHWRLQIPRKMGDDLRAGGVPLQP